MLFLIADVFSSSPALVHIFRFCVWLSYIAIKKNTVFINTTPILRKLHIISISYHLHFQQNSFRHYMLLIMILIRSTLQPRIKLYAYTTNGHHVWSPSSHENWFRHFHPLPFSPGVSASYWITSLRPFSVILVLCATHDVVDYLIFPFVLVRLSF
jgi:hypothetical protein